MDYGNKGRPSEVWDISLVSGSPELTLTIYFHVFWHSTGVALPSVLFPVIGHSWHFRSISLLL